MIADMLSKEKLESILTEQFIRSRKRNVSFVFITIALFNVNNRNTRTRCEISSKLTIKTPE